MPMITTEKLMQEIQVEGQNIVDVNNQGTDKVIKYLSPKTLTVKDLMDGLEMIDKKEKQLAEAKANMEALINKSLNTNSNISA